MLARVRDCDVISREKEVVSYPGAAMMVFRAAMMLLAVVLSADL